MARFRTLAGKVGAVLFTILSAFLFTPYYIRGMEEDLSLRTRLYLVVWTEWAGAMFCGFLLLCCIWHPDDSEMVFFRMHFRGAAPKFYHCDAYHSLCMEMATGFKGASVSARKLKPTHDSVTGCLDFQYALR